VRSWFERFFQQFPEIQFTLNNICVDRIFDMTGENTVITDWTIEYTNNSGTKIQNIGIDVVKISGGKVIEIRAFFFYPERLKDAWGEALNVRFQYKADILLSASQWCLLLSMPI